MFILIRLVSNFFCRTFKRIEKDIKLKRKMRESEMKNGQKTRDMGESYVDKDRAIAVVIGNGTFINGQLAGAG